MPGESTVSQKNAGKPDKEILKPIIKDLLVETDTLAEAVQDTKKNQLLDNDIATLINPDSFIDAIVCKLVAKLLASEELKTAIDSKIINEVGKSNIGLKKEMNKKLE